MTTNTVSRDQEAPLHPDDEYTLTKIIPELHKSNTPSIHNIKPVFQLVGQFIERVTKDIGEHTRDTLLENEKGELYLHGLKEDPKLLHEVGLLSCEITSKTLSGSGAHITTISLLKILANYSWEDKVILTLAAFVLTFGDFWLLVRIYSTNAINEVAVDYKSVAYKNQFIATNKFVAALVVTTRSVFEIGEIPDTYLSDEDPELNEAMSHVPIAIYWIIRSAVAAATQIMDLSCRRIDQYVATSVEPYEKQKLKKTTDEIRSILLNLYKLIAERKNMQIDNMSVLKILISSDDIEPPLYHGPSKTKVDLENLRKKQVLLLISGPEISRDDVALVQRVCVGSMPQSYEIVWIPVLDHPESEAWTSEMQSELDKLQESMQWYSVHNPAIISDAATKSFRDDWNFKSRPILVVLSPQGEVLNDNAIHMMRIWKNFALDLTITRELALWDQETWNLEFLVNDLDQKIQQWIRDDKYIFLYGSKDMDWMRRFNIIAGQVTKYLQVQLEMVYAGTNHSKGHLRRIQETKMISKQVSNSWEESTCLQFWARIDSMIFSKMKLRKGNDQPEDKMLQEILRIRSLDEWTLLAKGSRILVHGPGTISLDALEQPELWREKDLERGYVDHFMKLYKDNHLCGQLVLPDGEYVPTNIICPDCQKNMETYNCLICC